MNKRGQDFTKKDLGLFSAVVPIIGFVLTGYYLWNKHDQELGKYLLSWSIIGLAIECLLDFIIKWVF